MDDNSRVMGLAALFGAVIPFQSPAPESAVGAGLEHTPGDRRVTDLHDIGNYSVQLYPLIGSIEALLLRAGKGAVS